MRWIVSLALCVGCASDLDGTYEIATATGSRFSFGIDGDEITFFEPIVTSYVHDPDDAMTDTPNVYFKTHRQLQGEGGVIEYEARLWMNHDGGTGTLSNYGDVTVHRRQAP